MDRRRGNCTKYPEVSEALATQACWKSKFTQQNSANIKFSAWDSRQETQARVYLSLSHGAWKDTSVLIKMFTWVLRLRPEGSVAVKAGFRYLASRKTQKWGFVYMCFQDQWHLVKSKWSSFLKLCRMPAAQKFSVWASDSGWPLAWEQLCNVGVFGEITHGQPLNQWALACSSFGFLCIISSTPPTPNNSRKQVQFLYLFFF